MVNTTRRQLTLFVEQEDAVIIEKVRAKFNPRQSELIKCHVTLCREDEIEDIETVLTNILNLTQTEIVIKFGKAIRFDNGKGVLIPSKPNNNDFQELRRQILNGLFDNPRLQEAHITLMHPRNSTCTDDIYEEICNLNFPTELIFRKIALIEQMNGGQWETLQTFQLNYFL
ncbi:MAG: 2'-5' RNA ligase family protein [Bacteroidota bacterium]|nr:2'-5' RNA ligase family protein [Bacteroidota bacterium]